MSNMSYFSIALIINRNASLLCHPTFPINKILGFCLLDNIVYRADWYWISKYGEFVTISRGIFLSHFLSGRKPSGGNG